jgi:hypothetical protein
VRRFEGVGDSPSDVTRSVRTSEVIPPSDIVNHRSVECLSDSLLVILMPPSDISRSVRTSEVIPLSDIVGHQSVECLPGSLLVNFDASVECFPLSTDV